MAPRRPRRGPGIYRRAGGACKPSVARRRRHQVCAEAGLREGGFRAGFARVWAVAWAWQGGAKSPPAFTPPKLAPGGGDDTNPGAGGGGPVAKPQKPGKPKPTRTAPGLTTTAATPRVTATPTVTPTSATPTPSPSVSQTSTAAIAPSDSAEAESAPVVKSDLEGPSQESSGLPVWIPVSVLLVLAAATGVALYFRRRQT